jgi:putative transcriptional regulator
MATSNAFGKFSGRKTVVSVSVVDVAKIRAKTGLSQDRFATVFGMSAATVRNWEQHRTVPEGPARVLLTLIDREPVAVARALRIGPHSAKKAKRSARAAG